MLTTKGNMSKLIPMGIIVHIVLFMGVMDIYFKSPIQHGMSPHQTLANPPAKRAVLFVADGLRAESIFKPLFEDRAPFLKDTRHHRGAWGVSHTQVPTESRPGHVSIMAGIYEDPSAIMKGWKSNPVEFDSLINQSSNAWCWGSPDIVYLFNKYALPHIHLSAYSSDVEDFGKKQTHLLDEWVFKEVRNIFSLHKNDLHCGAFCENKNFFFLHLLGLDTAGHSYKPNSEQHNLNIQVVDNGIKEIEDLFENFFSDNSTAYIFTSDHGMTDWGSHGDGSTFETETPFIAWGAGIKKEDVSKDINQADITPLIATLIGLNIPINSVGVLPYSYLNLPEKDLAACMLANAKQLFELYSVFDRSKTILWFYKPYEKLDDVEENLNMLEYYYKMKNYKQVIILSKELIQNSLDGLKHIQSFSKIPILICVSLGLIYWLVYLGMSIVNQDEQVYYRSLIVVSPKTKKYIKMTTLVGTFLAAYTFFEKPLSLMHFGYIVFPVTLLQLILFQFDQLVQVINVILAHGWKDFLQQCFMFFIAIELLVFGFFDRSIFSLIMVIIGLWPITEGEVLSFPLKCVWFINSIILAIFPLLPVMQTDFVFMRFIFTVSLWLVVLLISVRYAISFYMKLNIPYKSVFQKIIFAQTILFLTTSSNVYYIAMCFEQEMEVPLICNVLSWICLVLSVVMLYISPNYVFFRLFNICCSLMSIYTMFIFNLEGPFITMFVILLYQWLKNEFYITHKYSSSRAFFKTKFNVEKVSEFETTYKQGDFRRAFFFLAFIMVSFFGTGNIASLNSFDPMWVRCFLTVFSPFTMMALILIKITIPFLMIICVFRGINVVTGGQIGNMFAIVLLFCDIMVFNFMFLVQNEGSWKEIGMSLSHFIIMEMTAVALLVFYYFTNLLTKYSLFKYLSRGIRQKLM